MREDEMALIGDFFPEKFQPTTFLLQQCFKLVTTFLRTKYNTDNAENLCNNAVNQKVYNLNCYSYKLNQTNTLNQKFYFSCNTNILCRLCLLKIILSFLATPVNLQKKLVTNFLHQAPDV